MIEFPNYGILCQIAHQHTENVIRKFKDRPWKIITLSSDILSSADNLCYQFGSRSRPILCQSVSGSKLFDTYTERNFIKSLLRKKVSR